MSKELLENLKALLLDLRRNHSAEEKNEIADSIDLLFDKLDLEVKRLKSFSTDKPYVDPNKVNLNKANILNESLEIIQKNYAPIFNKMELTTIKELKEEGGTIFLNRSKLGNKLIVKVRKQTINLEKYVAIELGYSNKDSIPWGYETNDFYTIDNKGKKEDYYDDVSDLTFILLDNFL